MVYPLHMLVQPSAPRLVTVLTSASVLLGLALHAGCGGDVEDAAPQAGGNADAGLAESGQQADAIQPETAAEIVTVTLAGSDEPFANPGMGWQTFHSFADTDKNLAGLPTGSAYARFTWRELEPTDGVIEVEKVAIAIAHAKAQGQTFMFRIMTAGSDSEYSPDWLASAGCKVLSYDAGSGQIHAPDLDDPVCRARHDKLISELGSALIYERGFQVDIGSVGLWGEWHFSGTTPQIPMPSLETRKSIVDLYFETFPKVPKLALIGDVDTLAYATGKGAGWRADCLGDMGFFSSTWNHMDDMYKQHVAQANASDAWKTAPVAWESCHTMTEWIQAGYDAHAIFQYALDMHGSFVNNKSAALPAGDENRADVEWLISRMGYRFALRSLSHSKTMSPEGTLALSMRWENVGVAPPYVDLVPAVRLSQPGVTEVVLRSFSNVRSWLPGPVEQSDSFTFGAMPTGTWQISVGILHEDTPVRLANEGRDASGWYPISSIVIE